MEVLGPLVPDSDDSVIFFYEFGFSPPIPTSPPEAPWADFRCGAGNGTCPKSAVVGFHAGLI